MCVNPIEWVSVRKDYDGKPGVTIFRDSDNKTPENTPHYCPREASQQRVLRQIERLASDHRISLSLGAVTGTFSLLLHLNLSPTPPSN